MKGKVHLVCNSHHLKGEYLLCLHYYEYYQDQMMVLVGLTFWLSDRCKSLVWCVIEVRMIEVCMIEVCVIEDRVESLRKQHHHNIDKIVGLTRIEM
jgi:hypothetical protein